MNFSDSKEFSRFSA